VPDTKCGESWSTHGTCCDLQSLQDYAKRDLALIDELVQNTTEGIYLGARAFSVHLAYAVKNKDVPFIGEAKEIRDSLLQKNITDSIGFLASILHPNSTFNASLKKCWHTMKLVRGNALCSTCSADSRQSFFRGKALISRAVCESIMHDCAESFKYLIRFLSLTDDYNDRVKIPILPTDSLQVRKLKFYLQLASGASRLLISREQKSEMNMLLDSFINGNLSQDAARLLMDGTLCGQLVNLQNTTYLEQSKLVFVTFPKFFNTSMVVFYLYMEQAKKNLPQGYWNGTK